MPLPPGFDRAALEKENLELGHDLRFFEARLEQTARDAARLDLAAWEHGVAAGRRLSAPARLELALAVV